MASPVLSLQNCFLTFGGTPLLEDVSLFASAGERICIVGRNGSGKSTLMKVAAGLVEADSGKRFVQPGATVRYLPQEPDFGAHPTVAAYVDAGLAPGDDPHRARMLLDELGLTGEENPATLSGGEGRRAALARTLAPEPDILLLDEPTNHLDIDVIEWLEQKLRRIKSALLLISHDRRFLSNLSRSTIWLDRGKTRRIDIGFGDFEAWRDDTLAQEELDRHKLARKIEREADWLRYGVTARRKRNVKRLSDLHALREKHRTDLRAPGHVKLWSADTALSGKLVIEAKTITKAFAAPPVVSLFSTRIFRADRLGIVGPNGAGKTTLLNLLIGKLEPDAGSVRLGTNLDIASLEQSRDTLTPGMTVADALTGGNGDTVVIGGHPKHVAAYMQDFLFSPEQIRTPVKVLSGGERARLMLARALAKPSNLLVLDEPTNDLDIETLDVLEDMLSVYEGTVILISHDRDFLDRVVTSVIAPEGGGQWIEYAGGYSDMLVQRGRALAPKGTVEAKSVTANKGARDKTANAPQSKRRLNPTEQHALATLPARIAKLEGDVRKLQSKIADPSLYLKNRASFEEASSSLVEAQGELAAAENRWLELEMLREDLGL